MTSTTHSIAPIAAVMFLFAATYWVSERPAPEAAQEAAAPVSASFEYYPAQFSSPGAEAGIDSPTF